MSLGDLGYNESWLQDLIDKHPDVLPVTEIETVFERPISAGREIACGHGSIDNLLLTGKGQIILVETKLHANSQARREVVAQALDYVAALSSMSFDDFEKAVCSAQHLNGRPSSLYDLVRDTVDSFDECAFIDAVAFNLQRGRMMVLVVGDGIRSEAESLANVLQSHAGAHFTFALVELTIYRTINENILVVPSTLAKTVMIPRAIVRIEDGNGRIKVEPIRSDQHPELSKPRGLSEIEFDEKMDQRKPGLAGAIRQFAVSLEPLGVYAELRASLNLKAEVGAPKPINLGYIQTNGQLWTNAVSWGDAPDKMVEKYLSQLAELVGGQVGMSRGEHPMRYVQLKGTTTAPRIESYLPEHETEWRNAIETLLRELRAYYTSR